MFHKVVMKKFVNLVALLKCELHNIFFVIVFFYCYRKAVLLHDKLTPKLDLLNFLVDLFDYLLNFY